MAVSKLVTAIGSKAGIIVNATESKTASAHDLRRTFGTRWAKRVMPAVLRKLMRHASIETTMGYYVDLDVDDMADDLWGGKWNEQPAPSNISGNNRPVDAPGSMATVDANNEN
jgi:integrase